MVDKVNKEPPGIFAMETMQDSTSSRKRQIPNRQEDKDEHELVCLNFSQHSQT
jgi:hypothetical protein